MLSIENCRALRNGAVGELCLDELSVLVFMSLTVIQVDLSIG